MYVVGSVFCVLGASLVNLSSSRDARVADRMGIGGNEALRFNVKPDLTKD